MKPHWTFLFCLPFCFACQRPVSSPVSTEERHEQTIPVAKPQGTVVSGGGDIVSSDRSAWFFGEPIPYCVVVSKSFPIPENEVVRAADEAATLWEKFLIDFRIPLKMPSDGEGEPGVPLATRFAKLSACDQPKKQLRLLFGEEDAMVTDKVRPNESMAAAVRFPFDFSTYRTGGTLWFRSHPYATHERLRHAIAHELGHVLGYEEDSPFVMSASAFRSLAYDPRPHPDFGHLESAGWRHRPRGAEWLDLTSYHFEEGRFGQARNEGVTKVLAEAASLPKSGSHSLEMSCDWEGSAPTRECRLRVTSLQNHASKVFTGPFTGSDQYFFEPGPPVFVFPSGEASFFGTSYVPVGMRQEFLGERLSPWLNGYFLIGGYEVQAVLESKRGHVLRLFDPELKTWWQSSTGRTARP